MRVLVLAAVLGGCKEKPKPVPVDPAPSVAAPVVAKKGANVAVMAPSAASHADWVKPTKQVAWTQPAGPPNDQEQLLAGTWVGTVGNFASTSAFMADRVMFALDGANKDLVANVAQAIEKDRKLASGCIWLELRPGGTGMRRECAIVNGEPSALDQNDPVTGQKRDFGVTLHWFIDLADKNRTKITFDDDMVVPAVRDGKIAKLVFRKWTLQVQKKVGDNRFTIEETFPEHDFTLPVQYEWEIAAGSFLP